MTVDRIHSKRSGVVASSPRRVWALAAVLLGGMGVAGLRAETAGGLRVTTPMAPPAWALLERELLRANADACREFYDRYFDDRGYLLCVERWGGDDGPDDAIENVNDWPILHALGARDEVRDLYKRAWEGHLRQYTLARTTEVPLARDGMYYKEFPTQMDWLHNGEGLTVFNLQGLGDPADSRLLQRVRRYAGFYLGADPGAPNYDPQHRIIRSMFNGSRGPLLRKATALDWAGDPIEIENRFRPGHGEKSYREMLEHFKDYNDIIGDHPQNLLVTNVVVNAFMLTGDEKYRRWALEYADAWRERMRQNGDIIPTNVGLDGKIGSAAGGKWYGGVYGWGFSVHDPASNRIAHRNTHYLGFCGFSNGYLLTGDDRYLDAWRRQSAKINAQQKLVNGKPAYPRMFGDQGWYDYQPQPYSVGALETYLLSQKPTDRAQVPPNPWLEFLEGRRPGYPEEALQADFAQIRARVAGMRSDETTPDTRLADDPMKYNPARVDSLIELMLGGVHPPRAGNLLHCRLRYFDPERKRAGLPPDVGALVEKLSAESATVTLVNTSQLQPRRVLIQAGGYAEHAFTRVEVGGLTHKLGGTTVELSLAPGCGDRLVLGMKRHTNRPTLRFPWERRAGAPTD